LMTYRQFALVLVVSIAATARSPVVGQHAMHLDSILPVDPLVKVGKLENGLRYYIRSNIRPEDRAELRLVLNAGSVLEDEDQRGLAHFVEHMAFNGTRRFPKQDLIDYLERVGMGFGPDLNAYTSFDETVYMLQIPTDSADILRKAFEILEDWAHQLEFEPAMVEGERGVLLYPQEEDAAVDRHRIAAGRRRAVPGPKDAFGLQAGTDAGDEVLIVITTHHSSKTKAWACLAVLRPDLRVKPAPIRTGSWGATQLRYEVKEK